MWESQCSYFTAPFPKSLTELGLKFLNSLTNHSLKLKLQKERMVFGSSTTTFCLTTELAELHKVTNSNFSSPIRRTMTAVKRSRQSPGFHTFSLSCSLCYVYLGIMIKNGHSCKLIISTFSTRSMLPWWRTSKCLQINFSQIITDA